MTGEEGANILSSRIEKRERERERESKHLVLS